MKKFIVKSNKGINQKKQDFQEVINSVKDKLIGLLQNTDTKVATLERAAGLPNTTIKKLINGERSNISLETLYSISSVFNCSLSELLDENINILQRNILFDVKLYTNVCMELCSLLEENNYELLQHDALEIINKAYNYFYKHNSKVDKNVIRWMLEEN